MTTDRRTDSSLRARLYRVVYLAALGTGRVQRWLAVGWREGNGLERALILPTWAVFRAVFLCAYACARATA